MKSRLVLLLKGFFVGGTMLVPGVSGGTMCIILGIYEELISSVSSFFKHKKKSFWFLTIFTIGAILGMIICAKPLLGLIQKYNEPMMYLFIGAVIGGVPAILRASGERRVSKSMVIYVFLGVVIVSTLSLIPAGLFSGNDPKGIVGMVLLVVAGFVAAIALVLPGISVSYMLLLMGMYEETVKAVSELYLPYLLPLGGGLVLGIVLTTKILETAMNKYKKGTHLIILGFIVGSVIPILPGAPSGINLIVCPFTALIGFGIIQLLEFVDRKRLY
ncbi:MAG: DUF368 domain-containing protein [Anaerovoracaceae bacterium]